MRTRNAMCALSLIFATACQGADEPDLEGTTQALDDESHAVGTAFGMLARNPAVYPFGAPLPTDYYFPTDAEPGETFPIVAMLQGGNVDRGEYSNFATTVASHGYIVVVPDLSQTIQPPGAPFPVTLLLTSQWVVNWVANDLTARNATVGDPLAGIVDTQNMGVVGHSAGAAAAVAAVDGGCYMPFCNPFIQAPPYFGNYARPASLKAAVLHGFQNCDPSGGGCLYPNTAAVPSMIVNGSLDDAEAAEDAYELFTPARGLVILDGLNHFGLTNENTPTSSNPEVATVNSSVSVGRTAQWTVHWLNTHLKGDTGSTSVLTNPAKRKHTKVTVQL